MPHNLDLILTLTGGLGAALIFGYITHRIGLSPIVGYLIAGVAVGPFTPGFVAHSGIAEQMAELGVILLMFGVGLHFHMKDLFAVGKVAITGAIVQSAVATVLGLLVCRVVGWSTSSGLVFGMCISVASTVVLLRVLADNNALHTRPGHVAIGWLLAEDLFTIVALVLLPVLSGPAEGGEVPNLGMSLLFAGLKVAALVGFTLLIGKRVIPSILAHVARTRSRELFTLTVLALALGIAVGSAKLFGASMALGAFLAGMVVGQSDFSSRAASEALPMRDAFAVLFFVSMGMLFDPAQLIPNAVFTLATLGVIMIGKPLAAYVVVMLLRHPVSTAVTVSIALAQIGEFSFILATLAQQLGILPDQAMQPLVAASIISIVLNPMLFKLVGPLSRRFSRTGSLTVTSAEHGQDKADETRRAVIVGYGPVGRTLATLLMDNGIEPTVVEFNHETVERLSKAGIRAVYGDASRPEILGRAGVRTAAGLIYSASGSSDATIRIARELNPDILLIARTSYVAEVDALKRAGADAVISAEGEIALAMTERLLSDLGASAEQMDKARDKVRRELGEM